MAALQLQLPDGSRTQLDGAVTYGRGVPPSLNDSFLSRQHIELTPVQDHGSAAVMLVNHGQNAIVTEAPQQKQQQQQDTDPHANWQVTAVLRHGQQQLLRPNSRFYIATRAATTTFTLFKTSSSSSSSSPAGHNGSSTAAGLAADDGSSRMQDKVPVDAPVVVLTYHQHQQQQVESDDAAAVPAAKRLRLAPVTEQQQQQQQQERPQLEDYRHQQQQAWLLAQQQQGDASTDQQQQQQRQCEAADDAGDVQLVMLKDPPGQTNSSQQQQQERTQEQWRRQGQGQQQQQQQQQCSNVAADEDLQQLLQQERGQSGGSSMQELLLEQEQALAFWNTHSQQQQQQGGSSSSQRQAAAAPRMPAFGQLLFEQLLGGLMPQGFDGPGDGGSGGSKRSGGTHVSVGGNNRSGGVSSSSRRDDRSNVPSKVTHDYWIHCQQRPGHPDSTARSAFSAEGKWMLFYNKGHLLDHAWAKATRLFHAGELRGLSAMKVSTALDNPNASGSSAGVIILYCGSEGDKGATQAVGRNILEKMQYKGSRGVHTGNKPVTIYWKSDAQTEAGTYRSQGATTASKFSVSYTPSGPPNPAEDPAARAAAAVAAGDPVRCWCDLAAAERVSQKPRSRNKPFLACPKPQEEKTTCNFFVWCEEVEEYSRAAEGQQA